MKYPAELIQIISIIAVITGITIEIIYGADSGFILITGGGLAFGCYEKIDRLRRDKRNNNNNNLNSKQNE